LIRQYKVAVIPGETFGATDGCYLRIAYGALSPENVHEGMARLTGGLKDILT
jgi:aspartate/methionine/tyrosine aminotransferase